VGRGDRPPPPCGLSPLALRMAELGVRIEGVRPRPCCGCHESFAASGGTRSHGKVKPRTAGAPVRAGASALHLVLRVPHPAQRSVEREASVFPLACPSLAGQLHGCAAATLRPAGGLLRPGQFLFTPLIGALTIAFGRKPVITGLRDRAQVLGPGACSAFTVSSDWAGGRAFWAAAAGCFTARPDRGREARGTAAPPGPCWPTSSPPQAAGAGTLRAEFRVVRLSGGLGLHPRSGAGRKPPITHHQTQPPPTKQKEIHRARTNQHNQPARCSIANRGGVDCDPSKPLVAGW